MMVLAGVDEAGLGPTLGPLATACGALLVPDDWRPETPWEALSDAVCRDWRKGERRIGVADSKILHRTGGLKALELAAGVFSLLANGSMAPALERGASDGVAAHPCYSGGLEPFPVENGAAELAAGAERARRAMEKAGAAAVHLAAAALYEPAMNRRFASGLNKNQVLLAETGSHLTALAEKFPRHRVSVVVDKQGGRNDYLPFLAGLFPGLWPEELEVGAERSRYRLRRPGGALEVCFLARADAASFPTALASLLAKYVRERAMMELNGWAGGRFPSLRPTAGYPQDARRWLDDARRLGVDGLELLIRRR